MEESVLYFNWKSLNYSFVVKFVCIYIKKQLDVVMLDFLKKEIHNKILDFMECGIKIFFVSNF